MSNKIVNLYVRLLLITGIFVIISSFVNAGACDPVPTSCPSNIPANVYLSGNPITYGSTDQVVPLWYNNNWQVSQSPIFQGTIPLDPESNCKWVWETSSYCDGTWQDYSFSGAIVELMPNGEMPDGSNIGKPYWRLTVKTKYVPHAYYQQCGGDMVNWGFSYYIKKTGDSQYGTYDSFSPNQVPSTLTVSSYTPVYDGQGTFISYAPVISSADTNPCDECASDGTGGGQGIEIKEISKPTYEEKYLENTKKNRFFEPEKDPVLRGLITPYDDVSVKIKVSRCRNNVVDPKNLELDLLTVDAEGNFKDVLISSSSVNTKVVPIGYDETENADIFEWKIPGWSNSKIGLAMGDKARMEALINFGYIKARVKIKNTESESLSEKIQISRCVHLWGATNPNFKFIFRRGVSAKIEAQNLLNWERRTRSLGFRTIFPFSQYNNKPSKFSFYVDLSNLEDKYFEIAKWNGEDYFTLGADGLVKSSSSCERGNSPTNYIFYNDRTYFAYSHETNNLNYLNLNQIIKSFPSSVLTTMREIGHSFCKLNDEYTYTDINGKPLLNGEISGIATNCALADTLLDAAAKYTYSNSLGEKIRYADPVQGRSYQSYWRPSKTRSIMDFILASDKFNVVSCAYCALAIDPPLEEDKANEKQIKMNYCRENQKYLIPLINGCVKDEECPNGKKCDKNDKSPKYLTCI